METEESRDKNQRAYLVESRDGSEIGETTDEIVVQLYRESEDHVVEVRDAQ